MHIPDNYLSPSTCVVMAGIMVPVWKSAADKTNLELSRKKIPLLGICSAFSFIIMMFNIPLPGGTSGHAIGSVLAAILLGPSGAVVSITIALAIQALFFGDGGILAFGANCFNMAFIMPFTGYYIYKFISGLFKETKGEYIGSFIAGYAGMNLAALMAAIEFGIQPLLFRDAAGLPMYCPYGLSITIPAMLLPHLLVVGFVEGLVTAAVFGYVRKVSKNSIYQGKDIKLKPLYVLLFVLIVLVPIGLFAPGTAFGEWDSDEINSLIGYIPKGIKDGFHFNSLFKDYSIHGILPYAAYILSGIIGIILIITVIRLLFIKKNKNEKSIID
ncbi:MAG: cobalt transporter CbiM [Solirubrobacterales bacterium]